MRIVPVNVNGSVDCHSNDCLSMVYNVLQWSYDGSIRDIH